ncbi:hypothetical protein [Burkholderia gladioli]|uniref:hypothetical protein n=1 Tax=Burkholderia gladioli TaxID=28095 RepID=UPI001374B1C8|nr:hypothetical protein [Burkholderia gladioli]
MRKEYDLKTDALETIVATTLVTTKHAALVAAFAGRTDFRSARYVKTRERNRQEWCMRVGWHDQATSA